jgi:hypothetical protein
MDPKAALARAPTGSRLLGELYVEIGPEVRVQTMAIATPHSVIIPVDAKLPGGGFCRATIELDHDSYEKAIGAARRLGGLPISSNMVGRALGQHADFRPLLPR